MSVPSFSRPTSIDGTPYDHKGADKELGTTAVVHDAVFGELSDSGPNYRNVSTALLVA